MPSFPDYPDHLITTDPRSPYYDDSSDWYHDMTYEQLLDEKSNLECELDGIARNYRSKKAYNALDTVNVLLAKRKYSE